MLPIAVNQQPREKQARGDGKLLDVVEIFPTIQGEGPFAGRPAVFVRLAGCNLQCPGCFSASTVIRMADFTTKLIPEIAVGDRVLSYDKDRGRFVKRKVIAVMRHQVTSVLRLRTESNKRTFVTDDHPFLVRGRGWVLAKNLAPGDKLVHLSLSELRRIHNPMRGPDSVAKTVTTSRAAGLYDNGGVWGRLSAEKRAETSIKLSESKMGDRNPMKDPAVAIKGFLSRKDRGRQTALERMIRRLGRSAGIPIRFVGDGSLVAANKAPDFILEGTNKLVEVWPASQTAFRGRDETWKQDRAAAFASEGYEVLFLEVPEGIGRRKQRLVQHKLADYYRNGETVKEVTELRIGRDAKAWAALAGRADAPLTVYNFEVEGTHTYVADTMVVHNCDTQYTRGRRMMTVNEVTAAAEANRPGQSSLVVITGGEPFRQPIGPLCMELLGSRGLDVQIETNGTLYQDAFPYLAPGLSVVCAPKAPLVHEQTGRYVTNWKYVVEAGKVDRKDGLPLTSLLADLRPYRPWEHGGPCDKSRVFVQPFDCGDPHLNALHRKAAVESCMKFGYRLSLQVHKILEMP